MPQVFRYQAVARDQHGQLLKNRSIHVNVSILDQAQTGPIVYEETHATYTNAFGLFNLNIGQGSSLQGTFSSINWAVNDKFLSIEIDFGSGFQQINVSQLLSVPYALYSGNPTPGPIGPKGDIGPVGPIGPQGLIGVPGKSINWIGSLGSAPSSPILNDAFYDSLQNSSFIWDGNNWNVLSKDGKTGPIGQTGLQGNTGPTGPPGLALSWKGSFGSPLLSPILNDAYYDTIQHKSYVWDGGTWQILAQDGNTGASGSPGMQGNTGPPGSNGLALNWLGTLASAPPNPSTNSAYYNSTLKSSYVYNGNVWSILAKDGNTGPRGSSFLKNFQFIITPLVDIADSSDMVIVQVANPWMVPPSANAVAPGKMICFLSYTSTYYQLYIAARGTDGIMDQGSNLLHSNINIGSMGNSGGHSILVSDGVNKWYVISH
ncbi:MAG: hypothetical protein IPN99_06645 [Bacteroidetes bacterium]|nr:hypothetical protein [Bacteroidota bacterium]